MIAKAGDWQPHPVCYSRYAAFLLPLPGFSSTEMSRQDIAAILQTDLIAHLCRGGFRRYLLKESMFPEPLIL